MAPSAPVPRSRAGGSRQTFACAGCGAVKQFRPGSDALECAFCGNRTSITAAGDTRIRELPLAQALSALSAAPAAAGERAGRCPGCAAQFTLDPLDHAGECPFCATPVVVEAALDSGRVHPRSLVPFLLDEDAAARAFRAWIARLRLRPGGLSRFARLDGALRGVYLPYWTYDARTRTAYRGERGTVHYVNVPVSVQQNGRRVTRMQRQARVRWTPVQGTVARDFDDVLVGASTSLPRTILERLAPWDLGALRPYDERYLSGFRSEVYQVGLDEGFRRACAVMESTIRGDVARDIGGDHQRIHALDTRHWDVTFKHLLLPVWSASFLWRGRRYRFVVNGQNGVVAGERPWSRWKIVLTAAAGTAALALALWALSGSGPLQG